ncbi:FAD binding domain-containing protein [Nocardioides sp. LHG3406-4]|uniref:FAD binding domain-containing protein n=1 Tax=Nocardioides sp. LHG3406-4 TaxID=2804575 RepID=UPI003CF1AAC0
MSHARPGSVDELLELRARHPDWRIVAGGTDLMVEVNFGRSRPAGLIDVSAVDGLDALVCDSDGVRIGAGVTFARLERDPRSQLAGLATAARAVASPQIRSVATLGGNMATASPAGDAHPILLAGDAVVEVCSVRGRREVPYADFFVSPGHSVLEADEVIWSAHLPVSDASSQHFSKVGSRNAMVIAVASVGLVVDWGRRRVGVGLGSVGPRPTRAPVAEEFLQRVLWPEGAGRPEVSTSDIDEFAELTGAAATPIDDVRGTADYRRHTVRVMARRTLTWAIQERRSREDA